MISETDKAYAAAFLDGEGCIAITKRMARNGVSPSYRLEIILANNHKGVLEYLQRIWQGQIHTRKCGGHQLRLSAEASVHLLTSCLPYLRIKEEEAALALRFSQTFKSRSGKTLSADLVALRESLFDEIKTLRRKT